MHSSRSKCTSSEIAQKCLTLPDDNNVDVLKSAGDTRHGPAMYQVDLQIQQLSELDIQALRARVVLREWCEEGSLQADLHREAGLSSQQSCTAADLALQVCSINDVRAFGWGRWLKTQGNSSSVQDILLCCQSPLASRVGGRAHPIPLYGVQHLVRELIYWVPIRVAAMDIIKAAQQTHSSKTGLCKAVRVRVCCCCLYSVARQAYHGMSQLPFGCTF